MRVSVDKDDKGYGVNAYKYEVMLNGKIIDNCITADEGEGYCIIYVKNSNGEYQLNDQRTSIQRDIVYGDVKLVHLLKDVD